MLNPSLNDIKFLAQCSLACFLLMREQIKQTSESVKKGELKGVYFLKVYSAKNAHKVSVEEAHKPL